MLPTLRPGELVLSVRPFGLPAPGRLVVLRDPEVPARVLLKRVESRAEGRIQVRSDGTRPDVRDSRAFGPVGASHLIGVVVAVLRRPGGDRPSVELTWPSTAPPRG